MISEALKIARLNAKVARERAQLETLKAVISNPVVELMAGIVAISYLNKGSQSWLESRTGIDLKAGGEYAGLITIIGLQQIAPIIPDLVKGAGGLAAIPGLLALAAPGPP